MNPLEVKNFIRTQFENNNFKFVESYIDNTFDLVFQHIKLDYNIFFKFCYFLKDLVHNWIEIQEKVEKKIRKEKISYYNTYLVFALPEEELYSQEEIQKIIFDEYVCRKLIFPIDSSPKILKENILKFPFFPLDISVIAEQTIPKDVEGALLETDFDQQLIRDIVGRITPSQISKKIMSNQYREYVRRGVIERYEAPRIVIQSTRRLKRCSIKNFRGIGKKVDLNLDADVIVIYGPNGTGKTSIFDAIEWTVTGQVDRLAKPIKDVDIEVKDILVNIFHRDKPADVSIELNIDGEIKNIQRTLLTSALGKSRIIISNKKVQDKTAIAVVTGNESMRSQKIDVRRLRDCFSASHILKQDIIKNFITAEPKRRYDSLSYIFGTQDFIRFRDKTAVIINEIDKELKQLQNKKEFMLDQSNTIQQRIENKESEYKQLSQTIKSLSEKTLVKEIRELIANVDLPTSTDFIDRLKSPTRELAEIIEEISSKYIDTINRDLNASVESLKQNELLIQKELTIEKSKIILKNLAEEIKNIEKQKHTLDQEITKKKQHFLNLKKDQDKLKISIDNIDWLLRIKPFYRENAKQLKELQEEIEKSHNTENEILGKYNQIKKIRDTINQELRDTESRLFKQVNLINTIKTILNSIQDWKESIIQIGNITTEISELENQLRRIQLSNDNLSKELNNLKDEIAKVESEINLQRSEYDQKVQLIGRLKEYIDSAVCPLCGQKWDNIQILLDNVKEKIKELPHSLKNLLKKEKDLKKEREQIEAKINQNISMGNELKSRKELIVAKKKEMETNIELWESKTKSLPSDFVIKKIKIDNKLIPDKESLNQVQNKVKQEIDSLNKTKAENEDEFIKINKKYENLSERLVQLRGDIERNKKIFNNINQTLSNIQKEIRERNLTQIATEELSGLMIIKEKYTRELQINTKAVRRFEKELLELHNNITELGVKLKTKKERYLRESSIHNENMKEFNSLREKFLKIARSYVSDAEDKTLNQLLKIAQEAQNNLRKKYQIHASIKNKANDLKNIIISDDLKGESQSLQLEKTNVESKLKELKKMIMYIEDWNKRLESLKKETIKYRKQQEQNYFDLFKPTINLLYHRLNEHPLLGNIEILSERNELKIVSKISHLLVKNTNIERFPPSHVFSEAQLNTLAISIFLASAIEQGWSRFKTILIDDPVQNMDDLNSYAFLDLILGLASNGLQFIIATCNQDLYKLMLMKFRCLNKNGYRFRAYRLQGIFRDGPKIIEDSGFTEENEKEA